MGCHPCELITKVVPSILLIDSIAFLVKQAALWERPQDKEQIMSVTDHSEENSVLQSNGPKETE